MTRAFSPRCVRVRVPPSFFGTSITDILPKLVNIVYIMWAIHGSPSPALMKPHYRHSSGFEQTQQPKLFILGEFHRKPYVISCSDDQLLMLQSGAPMAIFLAHEISSKGSPPTGLILVAPSLDNTTECLKGWEENKNAPWVTPKTMELFQAQFLQEPQHRSTENWAASPLYAPSNVLTFFQGVRILIVAMGVDILYLEAVNFYRRLQHMDHKVALRTFHNYPHMALLMQKQLGKDLLRAMRDFILPSASVRIEGGLLEA